MKQAFLCLGGNMGKREESLTEALSLIRKNAGDPVKLSSVYETASWGNSGQPDYLNQVVQIDTQLSASELLECCMEIEKQMGRTRNDKWENRIIDIDILLFGNEVISLDNLVIPHPHMQNRKFVLIPLNEIAPDLKHPVFNITIHELLTECQDTLEVRTWNKTL